MLKLEQEDRNQLATMLNQIPQLETERGRRQMLELSGLERFVPNIDLSGGTFFVVNDIISQLSKYGYLTFENHTLGMFLNTIKGVTGIKQQKFLDKILNKYDLMTPIIDTPDISEWQGQETPVSVREKIIGENTLRPIAFLAEGVKVSKSVVYIGVSTPEGKSSGSGFMVAPNLLLTNNHVLPYAELVKNAIFRFNYEENFLGEAQAMSEYRAKAGGIFYTQKNLDYSLVEIEGYPGKEWGYLPLDERDVRVNNRVSIIQHPMGRPKEIAMQNNLVQYVGENVVQYLTSTMPGSSGSPVFNDNWEVVALHHAGGNIADATTGKKYFRNQGIWVGSILEDLPEELRQLLAN